MTSSNYVWGTKICKCKIDIRMSENILVILATVLGDWSQNPDICKHNCIVFLCTLNTVSIKLND